jgi:hypothetical protein
MKSGGDGMMSKVQLRSTENFCPTTSDDDEREERGKERDLLLSKCFSN